MSGAARRRPADERGITLIELVILFMVIAILVAIAIPAFFGFHRSAQDRAVQSELRGVLASEEAFWGEEGEYTAEPADLSAAEATVAIHDADPAAGVTITLNAFPGIVCLERASGSGVTFGIWQSAEAGTYYGRGGGLTGACPDQAPAGYAPGGW